VAYLAGLIITALFFLAMHYFTELSKNQKLISTLTILAIISSAIAYNTYTSAQQEKMMDVVLKFKQNKTIKCGGTDVNSSNYTLSIGTYTFIGKKGTPNYAQMISASSCE
jgi:energy-coupling factor transporter transmembrane protein EcfT